MVQGLHRVHNMRISAVLALLCALIPGLQAWVMGRRLIRLRDDPALPERLLKHQSRLVFTAATCLPILILAIPSQAIWAAPLAILGVLVGQFPARRVLFEEGWGLGGYLWHVLRFGLAGMGFWVLLAATPAIVPMADSARWPLVVLLAVILAAWNNWFADVYPWMVGASPLDRPDLEARFAAILNRAAGGRPRLYRFGPLRGRLANALALPSRRRSAILFGETLLTHLEPDELTAVFAHEVAHLEQYQQGRLRWITLGMWVNIAVGVLAAPASLAWLPKYLGTLQGTWPLLMLWIFIPRIVGQKSREVESDRRALELCGDGEVLIRALTKIHALARLPRRWSLEAERAATHPSLAHRIQAIRAAAGLGPRQGLELPATVGCGPPGTFVVLEADRVSWLEGVPTETPRDPAALYEAAVITRSVRYSELTELRLEVATGESVSLVATDRGGQTWSVPLNPQDVAGVQQALDVVDQRIGLADLAPRRAKGRPRSILAFLRDVGRNLLAGLRIAAMRQVALATFHTSVDHLVLLAGLNTALLLALDIISNDFWTYRTHSRVISVVLWTSLLLFTGYVMTRFERNRTTTLAFPVILLSTYPAFLTASALVGLAEAFEVFQGRSAIRQGLWYAYYGWLALATIFAMRTALGRWTARIALYGALILTLAYIPAGYFPGRVAWGDHDNEEYAEAIEHLPSPAQEEVLQRQPHLLQQELEALKPQRPGMVDLYFVGFGAYADQDVFMKEVESIRTLFDERFDTVGRSLALINNPKTLMRLPIATASNLALALERIERLMDPEEDVLFLYLTSHGSPSHELAVTFDPLELQQIDPATLRDLLAPTRIKWRVIVVSACYSGGFIEPLKNEYTLIAAAAAADRQSFGCGHKEEFTYFGKAYFDEALRETFSFLEAFDRAKAAITIREGSERKTPSEPQVSVGSAIREKLQRLQHRLSSAARS